MADRQGAAAGTGSSRPVRITPLGGVGRFGGNAMLFEVEDGPALVVDCGVRFLDGEEAPGFDFGLCDVTAIERVADRLAGYLLTHGHEDHVGALPYAYERAPAPVFGTPFTLHRVRRAFERAGAQPPQDLHAIEPGGELRFPDVTARFFAVSHSIPGALAVELETPGGRVVHSGDFRVDHDPLVGPPTDLEGLAAAGDRGVDLLVADSTGAGVPGSNPGERSVVQPLVDVVEHAQGRVCVTTFGSHVQRVAACAEVCRRTGRRMVLLGRSLKESVRAARDLGLLPIEDVLMNEGEVRSVPPGRLLIVAAGCQGERHATFTKLARNEHRGVALEAGDLVIYSARIIPGSERRVAALFDALANRDVAVVDGGQGRHASGHGSAGDLEALLAATRPRQFGAIHGGGRQLAAHRALAEKVGLAAGDVVDLADGMTLVLERGEVRVEHMSVPREPWVIGRHVVEAPESIAGPRRRMARGGVVLLVREGAGIRAVARGVSPGVTAILERIQAEAEGALPGGPEAVVARVLAFLKRRYQAPPEIVLVA